MLTGPFKKWRHLHKFQNINGKQRGSMKLNLKYHMAN
jgi:ligand-binding SRPBCC domain-containing protein